MSYLMENLEVGFSSRTSLSASRTAIASGAFSWDFSAARSEEHEGSGGVSMDDNICRSPLQRPSLNLQTLRAQELCCYRAFSDDWPPAYQGHKTKASNQTLKKEAKARRPNFFLSLLDLMPVTWYGTKIKPKINNNKIDCASVALFHVELTLN